MRHPYHTWLIATTLACGAPTDDEISDSESEPLESQSLGTLEQPIHLFHGYGVAQSPGQGRCGPVNLGGKCAAPNSKERTYRIDSSANCPGALWVQTMQRAVDGLNAWHTANGTGYQLVRGWPGAPVSVSLICDADHKNGQPVLGEYNPTTHTCHDSGRGQLCQVARGHIVLAGNNLMRVCEFHYPNGLTWDQCWKMVENTARHELGHEMGLGHFPMGLQSGTLMAGSWFADAPSADRFNQYLTPSAQEANLVWGYCPAHSRNSPNCEW